ncbi:cytochrome oxidase small assembly protein [Pseudoduganella lurida]|nr:cytochrome oxidase small assembly protein [Pseudoduganella lurida]
MTDPKKGSNLRLALILGGLALLFFVSVFVKRIWLS